MAVGGISNEEREWIPPPPPIEEQNRVEQRQQLELAQASQEAANNRVDNPSITSGAVSPGHTQTAQLNPIETRSGPNDSTRQYFSEPGSKEQFYKQTNKDGGWSYYRDDGVDRNGYKTATPLLRKDKDGNDIPLAEGNRNLYDKHKGTIDKFEAVANTKESAKPETVTKPETTAAETKLSSAEDTTDPATAAAPKEEATAGSSEEAIVTPSATKDAAKTKPGETSSSQEKTTTGEKPGAKSGAKPGAKTKSSGPAGATAGAAAKPGASEGSTQASADEKPATEGAGKSPESPMSEGSLAEAKPADAKPAEIEKPKSFFSSFSGALEQTQALFSSENAKDIQEKLTQLNDIKEVLGEDSPVLSKLTQLSLDPKLTTEQKEAQSLDLVVNGLRDQRSSETSQALSAEDKKSQLDSHKALLEKLVGSKLPEDQKHYAGMAASLLLQAQDNPETKDVNELSELTGALVASKDGEIDVSSIFSKADDALGHLEREELADVYSNVVEKQLQGVQGLKDMLASEGIDPEIADVLLEGYSKPIGDIFSRLSPEERANVVELATTFGAEGVDQEKIIAALSGDEKAIEEFGLNPEQIKDAKIALVNGGLNYLKDEIGLTQGEVDKMSQLYKLSEGMMGADGKFNEADIPALAAALGVNDVKTLAEAKGLIEATIMSQVSKTAYSMAHSEASRQFNNHPQVQKGYRALQRPLVRMLAGGMIQRKLNQGWGMAMGIANREASNAIGGIRSNLGDDFEPMSRAMTAIESRDQLREGLGITETDSKISPEEAGQYFTGLSKESLASMAGDKEKFAEFLSTSEKNFNALNRASLESQISASITSSRDITGDVKDQLLGVNKYLSVLANYDQREGMTQETLKQTQEGLKTAQNVLDRALGVTGDADRVKIQDAAEMFTKYQAGELGIGDLPPALQKFIDPSLAPQADPAEIAKQEAISSRFQGLKDFVVKENTDAKDFSVFSHEGKEYLGYTDMYGPGYVRENADGTNTRIDISESNKNASYQKALRDGGAVAFTDTSSSRQAENNGQPLRIDESLFAGKNEGDSYTQKIAEEFGLSKDPEYLAKYGMSAFTVNGKEHIGYIALPPGSDPSKMTAEEIREQGRLAYKDEKSGTPRYISDEATKAAYYGALMRDGHDISGIKQLGIVDSRLQNELHSIKSSRETANSANNSNQRTVYNNNNVRNSYNCSSSGRTSSGHSRRVFGFRNRFRRR